MKRDKIACECKSITYGMVEDAIKNGVSDYESVKNVLGFGSACGKCEEFMHFLVRDISEEMTDNS